MPGDWNSFRAFAGSAILDKSWLQHSTKIIQLNKNKKKVKVDDVPADVNKFYVWLTRLRTDLPGSGIPADRVDAVKKLLDKFFPRDQNGNDMNPVRFSGAAENGRSELEPVVVPLGNGGNHDYLPVGDGAIALAYIFSVVTPTVNPPTWDNYFGPLLILFSRIVYLAYIYPRPVEATPERRGEAEETSVPQMAGIMYLPGDNPVWMLSASMLWETAQFGQAQVVRGRWQKAQDQWRWDTFIAKSLDLVPWQSGDAIVNLPKFPPNSRGKLAEALYQTIFSLPMFYPEPAAMTTTRAGLVALFIHDSPPEDKLALPLGVDDFTQVFQHQKLKEKLLDPTAPDLFDICFSRDTPLSSSPVETAQAFAKLIKFRLAPHMFPPTVPTVATTPPTPDGSKAEIALPQTVEVALDTAAQIFYAANQAELIRTAEAFHSAVISRKIQSATSVPFGRCAETYGVATMLPHYFPITRDKMNDIRGAAVDIRVVGSTDLNALATTDFTSKFPDGPAVKVNSGWRYPCKNCQSLMPAYKIGNDMTSYNSDMVQCSTKIIK